MEEQVSRLAAKVQAKLEGLPPDRRLLIGIAGIPGSGKTTLARLITARLNAARPDTAIAVPMDGFHLTRAALSALPDPVNAHARRGAAFTFDAAAFHSLILSLREPISNVVPANPPVPVYAPSFDHAVKDPKENDIPILQTHKVVVVEGNYTALAKPPWSSAAALFDELWFVEVAFDTARSRLIRRHVKAGIAADEEEAGRRADENDLVNGREIVENMVPVDEVIHSIADDNWV
ncbi:probable kinase-related protein [Cephalotrichum gorgonifer]|uniref:Probable kinase-related protein n=1 Tax=Cephalotrichum gorgonifer TaxID=2041049 RepID=A0AAE8MRT5_9PEZI|nr:probable kinase-related protein [Cephalotrichum gorgonifer]